MVKKIKFLLTALALTTCAAALAAPTLDWSKMKACHYGVVSREVKDNDEKWCTDEYKYMMARCIEMGGGARCSDVFVRAQITQFGGPAVICNMVPIDYLPPGMTVASCIKMLTDYMGCPVHA